MTTTEQTTNVAIRNQPNNVYTRFRCTLCNGCTGKQGYLFELPDGKVVCDECAQHPDDIPSRLRVAAGQLRVEADELEARADCTYVTEVVPIPPELTGIFTEADYPNWMRGRLGLPPMTDSHEGERVPCTEAEALAWYRATYDDDKTTDEQVLARLNAWDAGRSLGPDAHGVPRRASQP